MGKGVISFSLWAILATSAHAQSFPQPLPVEEIPAVVSLPNPVPTGWLYVHDLFFNSILDGRVVLVDPSNVGTPVKAQVRASQFGSFIANDRRGELYTAETFYSRLTRGDRTDAVTIWDRATLEPKGEILLPDGKRGQSVTQPATFQLANEGQWALLWNFTPASSVTVLDLEGRKILSEVDTPGCSLIYPTVQRSFYTLCGDGGLTSFSLKPDGSIARQSTSKPFNQIEADPMFMMHAKVGGIDYFPTFQGRIQPIDARKDAPVAMRDWSMVSPAEAKQGWRPSGWQIISGDAAGRLFVLMQSGGKEGSHKDGGSEVWVIDPKTKARTQRIALKNAAVSIVVTGGEQPKLVAAAVQGGLDVYDAAGSFQHSLASVAHSPMVMHPAR